MTQRTVITIGNFDGVHRGHQALLRAARKAAGAAPQARVVALTFDPHPRAALGRGEPPLRLSTVADRVTALHDAGADEVIVVKPEQAFLDQTPEAFVRHLVEEHHPRAVVEGAEFRFGRNRSGNVDVLRSLGERLGFEVVVAPPVQVVLTDQLQTPVSSTLIRWLLARGRVADVARCLGRGFSLTATVVQGEQRGRTIGVPTANLNPADLVDLATPADGVYQGQATLPDGTVRPAAVSVGVKPTFDQAPRRVIEAHLLDFQGDLYGQRITLRLDHWLREQMRFPGLDALRAQLARDIASARRLAIRGDARTDMTMSSAG